MTYKGIFVDDQELVYAETLSTPEHLQFKPQDVEEVAILARKIVGEGPIIVAIDYRLGSGLVDHSQEMTVAARAMAEKKAVGQRS